MFYFSLLFMKNTLNTMDFKTTFTAAVILIIVIYSIYELIKEKGKAKKEKEQKDEQTKIFKIIGDQLSENSEVNKELLKYLKISSQKYAEEITESQMRIVIDSIFTNSQLEIYCYTSKILKENHIKGNEKEVTTKIKSFISNRYHKDSLLLKEFKFKEHILGEHMQTEWKEHLVESVLEYILKEKGEKSLQSTLQNLFDSFKYDIVEAILS